MPNQSVHPVPPLSHVASPRLNGGIQQRRTQSLVSLCRGEEPCLARARGGLFPGSLLDEGGRTPEKWGVAVDG